MKKLVIGIAAAVIVVGGCAWLLNAVTGDPALRWTQIDNGRFETLQDSDMRYQYRLESFDEDGNGEETVFKAERMLRDDAFLKLEVLPFRGVVSWEEVSYENLPAAVQEKFERPKA